MKVYGFYSKTAFGKFTSIRSAVQAVGDESRVYVHVQGIPNPWWVHPVVNGCVNRRKFYRRIPKHLINK